MQTSNFLYMKEKFQKWRQKGFWSKLSDILFVVLIVVLLIPSTRREFMKQVNALRAKIIQPKVKNDNLVTLSKEDYNWQMVDLEGKMVNFSQFSGKVVFINFWATWCGPCLGEMPEIQKLYDTFKNNSEIVFLIVSSEDFATIKTFVQKNTYSFPVFISSFGTPRAFEFSSIPTTFVINKKGQIVVRTTGATNWSGSKTVELLNNLIKE